MENIIGKWVAIPINDIKNRELDEFIHPDDLIYISHIIQPINLIIDYYDNYLKFKIDDYYCLRIKDSIIQESPKPEYFINDKVKTINSKGFLKYGMVRDFYWHVNLNKYIYILEIEGKINSKRYSSEDLNNN